MSRFHSSHRPRLYRSRTHRVFFGVCGGIAEHFDFSVAATRVLAMLLILCTGPVGLSIYIILGIALKPAPEPLFGGTEAENFHYTFTDSPGAAIARVQHR